MCVLRYGAACHEERQCRTLTRDMAWGVNRTFDAYKSRFLAVTSVSALHTATMSNIAEE